MQRYSKCEQRKIKSIQFGLLDPNLIKEKSVCEIISPKDINNLKMGPSKKTEKCESCHCEYEDCPGHFGYIKLAAPVFHIGFIDLILKILTCICFKCKQILINDYEKFKEISKIKNNKKRFAKIYELCKKTKQCKERKTDNNDINKDKDPFYKVGCNCEQPKFEKEGLKILIKEEMRYISPLEVRNIFIEISEEDLKFLGFDKRYSLPEWMIITNLLVCPPQVRPQVSSDKSQICQDTLTHQYIKILQINTLLKKSNAISYQDLFDELQYSVARLMKGDIPLKNEKREESPIKSLFDRLKGKEGRIRQSLMGKRVNFCARSVISPDPNISVDEIGIPLEVAKKLTFPVIVNDLNKNELQKYINNGPDKYPGAKKLIKSNGDRISLKHGEKIIENGDIVERNLINGDYVILNRQPSLHKMSMMGHRVKILPSLTFRLNLSVTTPYNADFDGDEMNLHVPQDYETISEIKNIMYVGQQIISPQSDSPIMGIVQDSLLGAKIFTERDTFLTFDEVNSLIIWINDFDINKIPMPCIMKPKPLWSGKQIFSLILPKELNLEKYREETPDDFVDKLNIMDNFVQIRKGQLIQGIICKSTIGPSSNGIVQNIVNKINPKKALDFLNNCQKLINNFILLKGWTVGISDLICDDELKEQIKEILNDNKDYIKEIKEIIFKNKKGKLELQPGKTKLESFEIKINEQLNNVRQTAGNLVQKNLDNKNHLKNMVSSGSKGKSININQIMSFVGQENVEGKRIPFNFEQRTLPHFQKNDYEIESRGFIQNSFLEGLNPYEFFFHAMSGREGIIDTSIKTAEIGYIERKLMKSLEDIIIEYDNTVRDSNKNIIQFLYGEDGKNGCPGEMVGSLASQSIGERITQMTLNTFHLAGVSSANVTLGVPRLKEILDISKNIKSPSMTIFLKKKEDKKNYNDKEIYNLIQKIEYLHISKVIASYKIYYEPEIRKAVEKEDQNFIDDYFDIIGDDFEKIEQYISPWVLRIILDKNYSDVYFNLVKDIKKRIQQELQGNVFIIHSTDLDINEKILLIRLKYEPNNKNKEKQKEKEKKEQMSEEKLKIFQEKLLSEMSLYGIDSVDKVYIRDMEYDEISGEKIENETILETKGTNLSEILILDEVDYNRTISNDINEIYQVLGIEAARKAIINELRKIFKAYEIDIKYRHLSILCDVMTHRGYLSPINRFGINKGGFSPIRKATFEESVKNFLLAGFFSEEDKIKGISENVLIGKLAKFGTGYFDLFMNIENEEYKEKNIEKNINIPFMNNNNTDNNINLQQFSIFNPGYNDFKQYFNKPDIELKNECNNLTPYIQEYKNYSPKLKESPKIAKTNIKYINPFDNKGMEEEDEEEEEENSDKDKS